jgi:uroporphyrinogen-III decarboxylase
MNKFEEFICKSDDNEAIPQELIHSGKVILPNAHTNSKDITNLAMLLKEQRKDIFCFIPFCTTVEAEAMGAIVNLGDENFGPRIKNYRFSSLEELESMNNIDFTTGRIKEVLESIRMLNNSGETPCLKVCGPFTILSYLIDPKVLFKALRKNKDRVQRVIRNIEGNVVNYILEGVKMGCKIISYSDPAATLDIIGPKVYSELSGNITCNILKTLEDLESNCIIHICGKTSLSLAKSNLISLESIKYDNSLTYGEAIKKIIDEENSFKIIGHNCVKTSPYKLNNSVIWKIELN